jgi:hypothetical protein
MPRWQMWPGTVAPFQNDTIKLYKYKSVQSRSEEFLSQLDAISVNPTVRPAYARRPAPFVNRSPRSQTSTGTKFRTDRHNHSKR